MIKASWYVFIVEELHQNWYMAMEAQRVVPIGERLPESVVYAHGATPYLAIGQLCVKLEEEVSDEPQ